MENKILKAFKDFSLLDGIKSPTVTVALSGGADSMSLLYALVSLKDKLGITVEAAHFNHLIRGEEAYRDQHFCEDICKKLGIKLYVKEADVPLFAKQNNLSEETAARILRYQFFESINKGFVATAHNADDNLETVIFNLARGSSIDGLCGIPVKRDIYIRPLILCARSEIEKYCQNNNIPFVTDSTNLSDDYTRNKIRHNILPVLREINPRVENTVLKTAFSLKNDGEFINLKAEEFVKENSFENKLRLDGFSKLHKALKTRVIKLFYENVTQKSLLENIHINSVLNITEKSGKISLPDKWTASSDKLYLKLLKESATTPDLTQYSIDFTESDDNFLSKEEKINNLLLNNCLDCDKIVGKWKVRTRQSGDSIRLNNRGCTKTLTKLYSECKIPLEKRDILPIIADNKGVIWIYGIGVAQRCAVTKKTKHILKINAKEIQSDL